MYYMSIAKKLVYELNNWWLQLGSNAVLFKDCFCPVKNNMLPLTIVTWKGIYLVEEAWEGGGGPWCMTRLFSVMYLNLDIKKLKKSKNKEEKYKMMDCFAALVLPLKLKIFAPYKM